MSPPRFSVVIPTHERRDTLRKVLDAWSRQSPAELPFEVIVVDDGSNDGTPELLGALRFDRFRLQTARQANAGPATARNRALGLASGDLVLFTGDDIEPAATLLAEHADAHAQWGAGPLAVVGRIDWPAGLPTTATMRHVAGRGAQQFSFHYMRHGAEYDFRHFYTSNVSIARRVLDLEPTHFSTAMPDAAFEDAELAFRLRRHGLTIRYSERARSWHWHAYDAPAFFRRQLRCGAMAQTLVRMHPGCAPLLGVPQLDRLRWWTLFVRMFGRGRLSALAHDLPARIESAVAAAGRLDTGDDATAEPLMLALFGFGYRAGLARARYPAAAAGRVEAAIFAHEVAPRF